MNNDHKAHMSLVYMDVCPAVEQVAKSPFHVEALTDASLLGKSIVALSSLGEGGSLIIRCGDMLTRFTLSMIYILHRCFTHMRVVKPFGSNPSESDRFLVFTERLPGETKFVVAYLQDVFEKLHVSIL